MLDAKLRHDTAAASATTSSGNRLVNILTDRQQWLEDWEERPVGRHKISCPLDTSSSYLYDHAANWSVRRRFKRIVRSKRNCRVQTSLPSVPRR